jgi:hypothetical protein
MIRLEFQYHFCSNRYMVMLIFTVTLTRSRYVSNVIYSEAETYIVYNLL